MLLLRVVCIDLSCHREGTPGLCQFTLSARPTNPPVRICRGTSLVKNAPTLGPCSMPLLWVLWWSLRFFVLLSEVLKFFSPNYERF